MKRKILLLTCALCVMLSSSIDVNAQSRFMNPRQVSAHVPIKTFDPHRQASRAPKTFSDATLTSGTYYTEGCYFYINTSDGWQDKTSNMSSVEVNVNGSDVTITGLAGYFRNAAIQGTMVGNTLTFANGQLVGTDEYGDEYLVGSNDGSTVCDIEFIYDPDARTLSSNTKYIIESNAADSIYPYTYWYYASFCSTRKITIRLNPYSVDWNEAYLYAWTGSSSYGSKDTALVAGQRMTLAEDGWWTYSFEVSPGTSFYIGFDVFQVDDDYDDYSPYFSRDGNDNRVICSESTCYEISTNDYFGDHIQTTDYHKLTPDESNTFAVHVATAGTFGLVMVQALEELTWADVWALTVTGSLNESDMNYFHRMTNLQQLDLSGTDITNLWGCQNLAKLRKVVLPTTCTTIKDNAFYGCTHLSSINLEMVQTVGNYAFYKANALPELNMPNVLSIGDYAFAIEMDTTVMASISMPVVQSIGNYAFWGHLDMQSITIPMVQNIGAYAFSLCVSLRQVDISNATSLGVGIFYMSDDFSPALSQVILSEELEELPDRSFYGCRRLKSISLPASLTSIGDAALPYITNGQIPLHVTKVGSGNFLNATSISIPSGITQWNSYSTSWTDVYCHVVAPTNFDVFKNDNVANTTLHVPAISLEAYKLHDTWYKFGRIVPMEGDLDEITIRDKFTLLTTEGIADNADLTIDSNGELTVSAGSTLSLNNYMQRICTNNMIYKSLYSNNTNYYYAYWAYTGMLLANSAITANNVDVNLVIENNRWNFFSLPFDVDMSQFENYGTDWIIREYSGANRASGNGATWNNVPANGMLHANTGYILFRSSENWGTGRNIHAVHNVNMQNIFATGDVNVPLTEYSAEFPQNRSWNLIGNPYPCSFDIQYMDFDASITTWNGSGYEAYTSTDDHYVLRPAEAFFVQAPQGTSQITFHKEGRSAVIYRDVTQEEYNNYRYYSPRRSSMSNDTRKVFNFTLSNADYSDRARLVLNENASADYELNRDAAKMLSTDKSVPQLYISDNGVLYAINERPATNGVYYMSAFFGHNGEYTIKVQSDEVQNTSIILTDTQTGVATDLSENDYTFTTEGGTFDNRFVISFVAKMPEGLEYTQGSDVQCTKVLRDNQLIIIKNGNSYNMQGQLVK